LPVDYLMDTNPPQNGIVPLRPWIPAGCPEYAIFL
jgi:hypothetical protein